MGSRPSQRVGWVERSDTHQLHFADMMGFARAQPILRTRCYSCAFFQCKAHARLRVQWASGVPHALFGRKINQRLGRIARRGRERASSFLVIASGEAIHSFFTRRYGLLRGACYRARIRATRWLAMTAQQLIVVAV